MLQRRLCLDGHVTQGERLEPCCHELTWKFPEWWRGWAWRRELTAVDVLGGLLLLGAGAVLGIGLGGEASLGACVVEVAAVIHGLLERVAFPAEDVVTMSGGTTDTALAYAKRWE